MSILDHINKQAALIGLLVAFFLVIAFFFYLGGNAVPEPALTKTDGALLDATLGQELLLALAQLKSTKLDTSLFEDPLFNSLKDFSIEIAPQPVGRRNPFAALGSASDKTLGVKSAPSKNTSVPTKPVQLPNQNSGFELE